ncbi:MAG: hypothetical protein CMN76_04535 [Spirochaetaceae bacterium]|nr:hypothetical protein [Spirochaetaceae bacterium]
MNRILKKRSILGLMAGLLTLGLVSTHCGRSHWHSKKDPAEMADKVADRIAHKLDLSDSQEEDTRKLALEVIESGKNLRTHRKDMMAELEKQFSSETFDPGKLNEMSEKSEAELKAFRSKLVQNMARFHALLTPEQKEEAAEYLSEFRQRFEH